MKAGESSIPELWAERDVQPLALRERLVLPEAEVLDRELRVLSNESFALGKQIGNGKVGDDEAKSRRRSLLGRVEALSPKVDAIALEVSASRCAARSRTRSSRTVL